MVQKTGLSILLVLLLRTLAAAQTQITLPPFGPGLGALQYTLTISHLTCHIVYPGNRVTTPSYSKDQFAAFYYVPDSSTGLAKVSIGGLYTMTVGSPGPGLGLSDNCPSNGFSPTAPHVYTDTSSKDGGLAGYTITITPHPTSISAQFFLAGYINPKWEVIGILYAPPGAQNSGGNNVDYTNSTLVSVTNSIDKTWSSESTLSSTLTEKTSLGLPGVLEGSVTYSQGATKSYTQGTEDDTSTTVSKTTALGLTVQPGPSGYVGIDHNWDLLLVWLNPVTLVNLGNGGASSWSGYGFNSGDDRAPKDMEIAKVNLGCLNGDWNVTSFPTGLGPSNLAQMIQQFCGLQTWGYPVNGVWTNGPFLRSWASTQTFDSPDTPPASPPQGYSNASLSPTDFQSIAQFDPWYICPNESPQPPSGQDWTTDSSGNLVCPSPNPADVAEPNLQALEAEFTPISTNGPVPYAQGQNFTGTIGYENMNGNSTTNGKDSTRSFGWEIGMKYESSGGVWIFSGGITASVTRSGKETSTVKSNKEITTQTTSTVSATLGPPPNPGVDGCPAVSYPPPSAYTNYPLQAPDCGVPIPGLGPSFGQRTSFNVYEDNQFGSFLFSPVYY
jgi:hypothetical protein